MCLDQVGSSSGAPSYDNGHHHGVPHTHRHPPSHLHAIGEGHQGVSHTHANIMYGTMRPNQRQHSLCLGSNADSSFHDFVPPPPPMFENGGGPQCPSNIPLPSLSHANDADLKNSQKPSSKSNKGRPVVAPKPKLDKKGQEKTKEKKKRESTV